MIAGTAGSFEPSRQVVSFDVRRIGRKMPRQRYQRGTLRTSVPAHGDRPEQKLPRGQYWAQWYQYVRQPDGSEKRRRREKIITRELAEKHRIAKDYTGSLNRGDAQRVLDLLIAQDSGTYVPPNTEATFGQLASEWVALSAPNWGPHTTRTAGNLVEKHLITGAIGKRPVVELTHVELQTWINGYVELPASRSLLNALLYHTRTIFEHAIDRGIIERNPARKLKATARKRPSKRALSMDECRRLLSAVIGRDHLILRAFVQLGLRPEEMFALRRDDVSANFLRIDEAIVDGEAAPTKTEASEASVYLPAGLAVELRNWIECSSGEPHNWVFPAQSGGPINAHNYLARTLKPAAIRAGVGVTDTGKKDRSGNPILRTDVNFQVLRRTCATLFGAHAKDPRLTQAQLRHADPTVTLRHYQQAIPEELQLAAVALEAELTENTEQELNSQGIQ